MRLPLRRRGRPRDGDRIDPVTGLLSEAAFSKALEIELERARRREGSTALLIGELDGGEVDEPALRSLGELFGPGLRGYDSAARIAGARVAVLAPDCDEHGAYMLGERMRLRAEGTLSGGTTLSLGVAASPIHGESADSLTRAAEEALHAAQRLGGNRLVISSAEVHGALAGSETAEAEPHVELGMLLRLAEALDVRESGSFSHSQRVGRLAELAARELGLTPDRVERVRVAGVLHDVGRVSVPEDLLRKPGPLTAKEWTLVRTHPEVGARLVETTDFDDVRSWVLTHHERPDGEGYPDGVDWDDVPLEGRILGVADAWEAMTSERSYRPALAPEEAARELRRGAGSQFDEGVVDALLRTV